jgi:hypothetical protein
VTANPYPTRIGFGLRYFRAAQALRRYGQGWSAQDAGMYTRAFDSCFENFDGDALVWRLMDRARVDEDLARGIRLMGENVWPQWEAIYRARSEAPLFSAAP